MRHYPRAWNRILTFTVGLILLVGGVGVAVAQLWPRGQELWLEWGNRWNEQIRTALGQTQLTFRGIDFSWITLLVIGFSLVLAIILLATIFSQSGGRTREALNVSATELSSAESGDRSNAGTIIFTTKFMDELVRKHLEDEPAITSVTVSNWRVKQQTALQIKIKVGRGASPYQVFLAVDKVSQELDRLLGRPLPLLIHLVQGNMITESFASNAPRVV